MADNPADIPVTRVPSHGKGRLRVGGTNKGAGRPPDAIRAALRVAIDKRRGVLEKFADSNDPNVAIKAMDMMLKYGLGTPTAAVDAQGNQTDMPLMAFVPAPPVK